MCGGGDGAHGRADQSDCEERDRTHVGSQVAEGNEERRGVEERRQDGDEDEIWR